MSIAAIQEFSSFLSDISQNIPVQENSTLSEKFHPNTIKARTKVLFRELANANLEPFEKSQLYSNLGKGLNSYISWMRTNEQALRSIVDDYGIVAPKIGVRALKIETQARTLLQLHQDAIVPKTPLTTPEAVEDFHLQLENACSNIILSSKSTMTDHLKPSQVEKKAEELSSKILSEKHEKTKKVDLLTKLDKGLQAYSNWMKKNKTVLEEKVVSYDAIAQKIDNAREAIKWKGLQLREVGTKLPEREVPDQFKKLYNPKQVQFGRSLEDPFASCFPCFGSPQMSAFFEGQLSGRSNLTPTLKEVVQELQQDKEISSVIEGWHQQKGNAQPLTLSLQKELEEGTCFGQVMTFIAAIKALSGKEHIQSLYDGVSHKNIMKYQLLNTFTAFANNSLPEHLRHFFSGASSSALSKMNKMFPVTPPVRQANSEEKIAARDKNVLTKQLNELLSKDPTKRTAIVCNLHHEQNKAGHSCLIYCNPTHNTYFYYDSSSQLTGGLFAANSTKALVNGAVGKLSECAAITKLPMITLHRFEI